MIDILPEVTEITRRWNTLVAEGISEDELEIFHKIMDRMLERSLEIVYTGEVSE